MNNAVFADITYGLYVIGSKNEEKLNAQIANTAIQVSANPQKVTVCLNKQNLTHEYVEASGVFSVSIISTGWTLDDIGKFGFKTGRTTDKFAEAKYKTGITGAPIITDKIVSGLECEVEQVIDAGTHSIFLGKVVNTEKLSDDFPMSYKYYHEVVKGFTPPNAPVSA
jgi:ferric-chelate reductase [NAD(P)H]